jgi:hypothetical protein
MPNWLAEIASFNGQLSALITHVVPNARGLAESPRYRGRKTAGQ